MHIYSTLKNYLKDNENFIAILPNYIYLYNVLKIDSISTTEINIYFKDKLLNIKGNNLKPCKCINKELSLSGNIESVSIYER